MSPDGEIKEGYTEFRKKIPVEIRIAFKASGPAVSRKLRVLV